MSKASKHKSRALKAIAMCHVADQHGDSEAAHGHEDRAYIHALKAIKRGYQPADELAERVLDLRKLEFSRWYA